MTNPVFASAAPRRARPFSPVFGVEPETQVRLPQQADVPLPKTILEEIVVPASINGRDLSLGKP